MFKKIVNKKYIMTAVRLIGGCPFPLNGLSSCNIFLYNKLRLSNFLNV